MFFFVVVEVKCGGTVAHLADRRVTQKPQSSHYGCVWCDAAMVMHYNSEKVDPYSPYLDRKPRNRGQHYYD